jgi:hypothetical protein
MDVIEKRKQYYLDNKDKLLTYSKQYYKKKDKNMIMNIGLKMGINILKKERKREKIKKIKLYQIL